MSAPEDLARPLPRGPHGLTRDAVLASQRGRMLDAIARAVADKGYGAATVADVVAGAGVSRKTFYEHFRDKEECFLAAFDAGVELLLGAILGAEPDRPGWLALTRARVRAYLETLAAEPAFARTFMIEVFAAGPRALERRGEVLERFEQLLAELYEETRREFADLPDVAPVMFTAAVGAVNEVVTKHVRAGRVAELPQLEGALVRMQVALFTGQVTAAALELDG
jgi:AcrR family transcriptional regulator